MRLPAVALSLFVAFSAAAQAPPPKRSMAEEEKAYRERLQNIVFRAWEVRPRRRDAPLRELNISDNEIREIEALTSRLMRDSMVNISPVVGDCPCEEGPTCTAQVYVVATTAEKTLEVQFSRIRNAWQIGPVQAWWTRNANLKERFAKGGFPDYREYMRAVDELLEEFPMCVGKESAAKTE
jgi:hypothetical protein